MAATFDRQFTQAKRLAFLQQIRNGMQRGAACDVVFGENNPTRRKALRDYIAGRPDFLELVEDAEADATEHVREALYQAAVSGNVSAGKIWLELQGQGPAEKRGRPPKPEPEQPEDSWADLDNVEPIRRSSKKS